MLESLRPRAGIEMYINQRASELAEATIRSHKYRLDQFCHWCEQESIDNLNDLTSRDIHRFRVKRRDEDGLATASMKGQLATLRIFLRFCASIDAVTPGIDEQIILPKTTEEDARDEMLDAQRADEVLSHLSQYRYATLEHALLLVIWHTGLRIGAATGTDIHDYNPGSNSLELVHRPDQGTTLKNKSKSERLVALSDEVCQVLDDWLEVNHTGVTDSHGRDPLFVTKLDRLSKNRARTIAYQYTRPCVYSGECPHDRDIDSCEAQPTEYAHKCPSALSPHPIRRGAITYHLQEDTPDRIGWPHHTILILSVQTPVLSTKWALLSGWT